MILYLILRGQGETPDPSTELASVADSLRAIPVTYATRGVVAPCAYNTFWTLVSKPARCYVMAKTGVMVILKKKYPRHK
jgi:hypothetical protein